MAEEAKGKVYPVTNFGSGCINGGRSRIPKTMGIGASIKGTIVHANPEKECDT